MILFIWSSNCIVRWLNNGCQSVGAQKLLNLDGGYCLEGADPELRHNLSCILHSRYSKEAGWDNPGHLTTHFIIMVNAYVLKQT